MEWLSDNLNTLYTLIVSLIAVASAAAALLPDGKGEKANKWIGKIRAVVDVIALNVLNAKKK